MSVKKIIMQSIKVEARKIRAGFANMFLSDVFCKTFAAITGAVVELYNTDGAQGAARGAGIGAEIYKDYDQALPVWNVSEKSNRTRIRNNIKTLMKNGVKLWKTF